MKKKTLLPDTDDENDDKIFIPNTDKLNNLTKKEHMTKYSFQKVIQRTLTREELGHKKPSTTPVYENNEKIKKFKEMI
jgi:hypothetical protein